MWYSYGTFLARTGNLGRAEEAFRQAIAISPSEPVPLLALACILWHNGVCTDALYLEHAITVRPSLSTQNLECGVLLNSKLFC
jgi:cytochrome c-type biogenesis protein CcmH/NrfG